jgi:serine/threonine protein kinase
MHEILHISHGDLKPENILIKHNVIKVGDFGFATFRSEDKVIDTRYNINRESNDN